MCIFNNKNLVERHWLQMLPGHDQRHGPTAGTLTAAGRAGHEPLGPTWLPQPVLGAHAQMALPSTSFMSGLEMLG